MIIFVIIILLIWVNFRYESYVYALMSAFMLISSIHERDRWIKGNKNLCKLVLIPNILSVGKI